MASLRGEPLIAPQLLAAMGRSLRHRGPDGHGVFQGPNAGIGCERLRVVDLRERADQPFHDPDSRCWMACNGEIYNAAELRDLYPDYPYRSRSDVEVILPLYLDRGAEGLAELDGMFGVTIWDEGAEALILARDRAGEKPLFFCRTGGELWFASEIQALLLDPRVSREVDEEAISHFLALGYVPEPRTGFRDIRKIEAGTIVRFARDTENVIRYWRPAAVAADGRQEQDPEARLQSLLRDAVRKQMQADVPVGVFVSGGIDSALIAALAAEPSSGEHIHTFTARFEEPSYDESQWAERSAQSVQARYHEVLINERSLAEALSAVTRGLAEPLADPAILPTYLLAKEARKHVTVILSGEGADELFGGYPTYLGHKLAPYVARLPHALRRALRSAVGLARASRRKVTLEFLLKRFLADATKPCLERHMAWFGTGAQHLLRSGGAAPHPAALDACSAASDVGSAMLLDYCTYLRDGLLVKNDRATMLNSLEARAPFLDWNLTEFALALPERYKLRGMKTKWLLKETARQWLPAETVDRRKRGLSVPVASWIDQGLRSEVDRLLDPARLARQELLDPGRVGSTLAEHRAGKANHAKSLWAVIVFQYWLENWVPDRADSTLERTGLEPPAAGPRKTAANPPESSAVALAAAHQNEEVPC